MAYYRCYVFDADDDILAVKDIECDSDHDAIDATQRLQTHSSAFELWKRNLLIHRQESQRDR
jgi:uncharacterized CHY-type Zn-finger protein